MLWHKKRKEMSSSYYMSEEDQFHSQVKICTLTCGEKRRHELEAKHFE